ncbi:MAG: hypothetical protein HKN82_11825 [Akkermansiaceae bacterium]|nr:hypothetical protein [Akkermansiaceae bacterium]
MKKKRVVVVLILVAILFVALECVEVDGHGSAHTYLASAGATSPTLKPFSWYRDLVVAGAVYHSFPAPYIAGLRAVVASEDHDEHRADRHAGILRMLTTACSPAPGARESPASARPRDYER